MDNTVTRSFGLLICLGLAALTLAGCSLHRHGPKATRCSEPVIRGDLARNLPPLHMPDGLDAPDTRNAIKIPELTEPERPRAPNEPCLSHPPAFKVP